MCSSVSPRELAGAFGLLQGLWGKERSRQEQEGEERYQCFSDSGEGSEFSVSACLSPELSWLGRRLYAWKLGGGPKVFETFDFKLHTYLVDLHNVWDLI